MLTLIRALTAALTFSYLYVLMTLFCAWPWRLGSPLSLLLRPMRIPPEAVPASRLRLLALRLLLHGAARLSKPRSPLLRVRTALGWLALPLVHTIPATFRLCRQELKRTADRGPLQALHFFLGSLVDSLRFGNGRVTRHWFDRDRRPSAAFHIPNMFHIRCYCYAVNHRRNPHMPAEQHHHDKLELFSICRRHGFPTVPVFASVRAGEVVQYGATPGVPLISKPAGLAEGHGTFERFWPEPDETTAVRRWKDEEGVVLDVEQVLERLKERSSEEQQTYLLQRLISNHQAVRSLSGVDTLCTLRVPTVCFPDGRVEDLPLAFFRMPTTRDAVFDNMSQGGIAYRVNAALGCLEPGGKYGSFEVFSVHPVTSREAAGFQLPYWRDTVALCKQAHGRGFANWPTVGWDVAITDDGPVLVEMNIQWATEHNIPGEGFLGQTAYVECITAYVNEFWPGQLSQSGGRLGGAAA